jgi:hypothetical protein
MSASKTFEACNYKVAEGGLLTHTKRLYFLAGVSHEKQRYDIIFHWKFKLFHVTHYSLLNLVLVLYSLLCHRQTLTRYIYTWFSTALLTFSILRSHRTVLVTALEVLQVAGMI